MHARLVGILLLALLLATPAIVRASPEGGEGITTVELRRLVRVPSESPVTVACVAVLTGPSASAVGAIELHARAGRAVEGGARTITVGGESLRGAIQRAGERGELADVDLARVVVRGSACTVMPIDAAARAESRVGPAPVRGEHEAAGATLRTLAAIRVAQILGVGERDLRLRFDDRDAALLATPVAGRVVEIVATGASDALPLSIRVYEGSRTVLEAQTRVGVEVRREVLVASVPVRRGARLEASSVVRESRWLAPGSAPADPKEAFGHELRRNLEPGDVVSARDLEPPIAVRRGDRVLVRAVRGTVVVRAQARALGTGRIGETIELESLTGDRRRFRGVVDGAGRVVVGGEITVASGNGGVR